LNYDVAATSCGCIFLSNQNRGRDSWPNRVCRAIYKPEEVSDIEIPEANGLIDDLDRVAEEIQQLLLEFEVQISTLRANVKEQITRC
jgi:hypothetical protein